MKIEKMSVNDIIPYINNAKKHPQEQIDQIKASVRAFGFNDPLAIDENNVIIEGHGRFIALKQLGYKQVEVIKLQHLNEVQKKQYILAHNKLTMNSDFDEETLRLELEAIEKDGDLDLTGFDQDEIDELLEKAENLEEGEGEIKEDVAPEPPKIPYSKNGDIWLLGRHRLMCGDSTKEESVMELMEGKKANMIFTDPPYLMDFKGTINNDGTKSFSGTHGGIKNDKMSKEEGQKFIDDIIKNIKKFVVGSYYVCFYRLGMHYVFNALQHNDLSYKALIIWDKPGGTLSGSDYKSRYEPIFYGWVKEHKYYGGKDGWDIWTINKTKKNDLHPTMKPLELVSKAVKNSSEQNGLVLDLFGGSGSTLIVCEQLNRINYSMELDEKYVDVIVKRYNNLGNDDIKLIRDGKEYFWDEIKEELE